MSYCWNLPERERWLTHDSAFTRRHLDLAFVPALVIPVSGFIYSLWAAHKELGQLRGSASMGYRMENFFVAPEHCSNKRRLYLQIELGDAMSLENMFPYEMKNSVMYALGNGSERQGLNP